MLVELDEVIKWLQERIMNTDYWEYEYDEMGTGDMEIVGITGNRIKLEADLRAYFIEEK